MLYAFTDHVIGDSAARSPAFTRTGADCKRPTLLQADVLDSLRRIAGLVHTPTTSQSETHERGAHFCAALSNG